MPEENPPRGAISGAVSFVVAVDMLQQDRVTRSGTKLG